jgi:hypothetical protein
MEAKILEEEPPEHDRQAKTETPQGPHSWLASPSSAFAGPTLLQHSTPNISTNDYYPEDIQKFLKSGTLPSGLFLFKAGAIGTNGMHRKKGDETFSSAETIFSVDNSRMTVHAPSS